MRFNLKKYNNKVITITAISGRESQYGGRLALTDVHILNGEYLTDHIWITIDSTIRLSNYRKGDLLQN